MRIHGEQNRNFGIGLMIGDPTGISAKLWKNKVNALSGGLGFGTGLNIHADYIWHDFDIIDDLEEGKLPIYYGLGIKIDSRKNDIKIGVRGVLGLTYIFGEDPFDIFMELSPVLELNSDTRFYSTAAIGYRYYLK
jgi:hypothetical protein